MGSLPAGEKGTTSPLFRFNEQVAEPVSDTVTSLEVEKIFLTIQGEGPYAGEPAVFIRLAGCNLKCLGCDTDYTSHREQMTMEAIYNKVKSLLPRNRLVVITGGEPFRQNIKYLVRWLADSNYRVQIETNGSIYRPDFPFDLATIVCSPKVGKMHPEMVIQVAAWKYIIEGGSGNRHVDEADGLPVTVLGKTMRVQRPPVMIGVRPQVYVQPFDSGNPEVNQLHLAAAIWSAQTFGYKLCVQIHKIIGLE